MRCPACGASATPAARFCDQCGTRLSASPASLPPPDRRVVTALFADLVDYVRMIAEHDPEEVKQRVEAALATMAEAVRRYEGTIEKFIGDAVFAVFGYPRAHDDDALRAALAAIAIREGLAELSQGPEPLRVRIGIATGEVVAAPRAGGRPHEVSLTGPAVVTAARIQDLALPDDILVDAATVEAARGRLDVEDRGSELLRGQTQPVTLYALRATTPIRTALAPRRGRLIGRAAERQRLGLALRQVRDSGRGRVVVVSGDAGMGKSRLIADLAPEAAAAGFAWTWVENVSYGTDEPFRFVRAFAQAVADEHGTDSGSMARRLLFGEDLAPEAALRIAGAIAAVARDAAFSGWEAEAPLAPTDPSEVVAGVLEAARRYVLRLAELLGPRVIVIDDAHWADQSSLPMMDLLLAEAAGLPFLILVGTRPTPAPRWAGMAHVEALELGGLRRDATAALVRELAAAPVDAAAALRLHDRTGGNPLFIGEVVRAGPASAIAGGGAAAPDEPPGVPLTLRSLLGARIDALSDDARELLQVGSVVGMSFATSVVAELLGRPVDEALLHGLAEAALITQGEAGGSWRFGHPLIHETAYASLLESRKRELHARVADQLATLPGVGIGQVARHRAAAGDRVRGIPLLVEAADEALALGAATEAAALLRRAARLAGPGAEADELAARADRLVSLRANVAAGTNN